VTSTLFGGTGRKVLLSLGALGVAGALAGMGTFATFTATTSASHTVASGTVIIALPAAGAANRLTIGATGLVPGDTVQRAVDLTNTGTQGLASVTLSTAASSSSLLDSDATNGLQMVVDRCSVAWTESGLSPAFTYACTGGTTTTLLTTRPVIQTGLTLAGLSALTAGGTDHLRVTLTLPSAASDALQGKTSTIVYTFNATQRAGTSQ
jgi:predicted ribosomally synthesized peptide with SipW-like signal peptide